MTRNQRGQGMTEYIILVALIAVVCIAAVKIFGNKTKEGFDAASSAVGGVVSTAQSAGGGDGASGAVNSAASAAGSAAANGAINAFSKKAGSK